MKQGMYLTAWDSETIQLSLVDEHKSYNFIYVKNEEHPEDVGKPHFVGYINNIKKISEPISKKRAYLLGYSEYYEKLMEFVNKA